MSKWGKNYSKPTKSFKKACLIDKFRTELFTSLGFSASFSFFYKKEDTESLKYNSAIQQIEQDIKEMRKIALQYASRLSRKDKKRFKRQLGVR